MGSQGGEGWGVCYRVRAGAGLTTRNENGGSCGRRTNEINMAGKVKVNEPADSTAAPPGER